MTRGLGALFVVALLGACASTARPSKAYVPLERGVPLEVQNRMLDDVVVYVVSGPALLRVGRATGMATTMLSIPRSYVGHRIATAARWPSGEVLASPPFILDEEGATMTIDPRNVDGRGGRS